MTIEQPLAMLSHFTSIPFCARDRASSTPTTLERFGNCRNACKANLPYSRIGKRDMICQSYSSRAFLSSACCTHQTHAKIKHHRSGGRVQVITIEALHLCGTTCVCSSVTVWVSYLQCVCARDSTTMITYHTTRQHFAIQQTRSFLVGSFPIISMPLKVVTWCKPHQLWFVPVCFCDTHMADCVVPMLEEVVIGTCAARSIG